MMSCAGCKEIFHRSCLVACGVKVHAPKQKDRKTLPRLACPLCRVRESLSMRLGAAKLCAARVLGVKYRSDWPLRDWFARRVMPWINDDSLHNMIDFKVVSKKTLMQYGGLSSACLALTQAILNEAQQQQCCADVDIVVAAAQCAMWASALFEAMRTSPSRNVRFEMPFCAELKMDPLIRPVIAAYRKSIDWSRKAKQLMDTPQDVPVEEVLKVAHELEKTSNLPYISEGLVEAIQSVISDDAARYCVCNGFSDGKFMIACEECDEWFHGRCVGIDENAAEDSAEDWKCPACIRKHEAKKLGSGTPMELEA